MKLLFWSLIALIILIAYETVPKIVARRIVTPDSNFYYGIAGLVREGMSTLRRTTMGNYPYGYATHPPTGWAKNNAISDYHEAIGFNDTIVSNNKYLVDDQSQIRAFNACP